MLQNHSTCTAEKQLVYQLKIVLILPTAFQFILMPESPKKRNNTMPFSTLEQSLIT